jgi:hypothetical protein
MGFITFRALKDFHLGALRTQLKRGAPIEFNGSVVRFKGQVHVVQGFEQLVEAGFLAPEDSGTALSAPRSSSTTLALAVPLPELPEVPQGPEGPEEPHERLSLSAVYGGSKESLEKLSREKGAGKHAALNPDKKHSWESELMGNGEKTCSVCGCSLNNPMNIDVGKPSLGFKYTDAYGVSIHSMKELPCPLFVGDFGGGIATNTHRTRKLTGKVGSIDERVSMLERENTHLHEQAARRQEVALDLLERLVSAAERLAVLGDVELAPRLLPDKGDIIDAIIIEELPERELVVLNQEEEDWENF